MHMSNRILSDWRKITPQGEIARINWIIQVCLTQIKNVRRVWFKESITHSTKFEWEPQIFAKLSFRELCDSKLSGLHPFHNIAIIHWVKNRSKAETQAVSSWDTNPCSNFCDSHWELICTNKWHPCTSETSTHPKITVGTQFHARNGTKTTLVLLPADEESSRSLLPSMVSLLSGSTVQPESTYSCILKATDQVWESQKRININTNHSNHHHSSP